VERRRQGRARASPAATLEMAAPAVSMSRPVHVTLRYWGAAVLVAGLIAAALIYAFASEGQDAESAHLDFGGIGAQALRLA
jgi:hypothetical protein